MGSIYKVTNIDTWACFVGYTSNLDKTYNEHMRNNDTFFRQVLHHYGKDCFRWEILYTGDDAYSRLREFIDRERGWRDQGGYNTRPIVSDAARHNMSVAARKKVVTEGVQAARIKGGMVMRERGHSQATKDRLRQKALERGMTEEHKEKIRKLNRTRDYSFMRTPEYRENMSRVLRGKKRHADI